jgi:hypothetical protein
MEKNTDIPTELLPKEDKVIGGGDGLDHDQLIVYVPGGQAMIMADFQDEYLDGGNPLEPDEYAVVPVDKDGEALITKDAKGRLLEQVWGYNPLS